MANETKQEPKFWMVWNPDGGKPQYRHSYKVNALAEAERLAKTHPGETFYVLEATEARIVENPVRTILLDKEDLPF